MTRAAPIRDSVRASLHAGMTPLDVLAAVAAELQPAPLPAADVARTVIGFYGTVNTTRILGLPPGTVASWRADCPHCEPRKDMLGNVVSTGGCGNCNWFGSVHDVPPEHLPALRRLGLRLAAGFLAAASEGV